MSAAQSRFGALVERPFRLLWIGRTTSSIGDALMPVALVFAVLSAGGSASEIGLVLATTMVVRVLLLLVGGALADRMPRRLLMVGGDLFLTVVQVIIGVLLLTGHQSVPLLLAASVCYGAGSAISKPAMTGLVPQTVASERIQQANSLMGLSRSAAQVLGPALAGVAVATMSVGWVYMLDAATFLISAVTLLMFRVPANARKGGTKFREDLLEGWREMASRTWYWVALISHAVWNLGSCAFFVLGPVIIAKQAGGASSWGLVSTCLAVGALVGGGLTLRMRPSRPLVAAHLTLLLPVLQLTALAGPSPVPVVMAAALLGGAGVTFANNVWTTVVQRIIPKEVLSRVSSYDWLVSFTVAPLGYAAVGPLSERLGVASTLHIAASFVVVPVVVIVLMPQIRSLRQSRDGEFSGWAEVAASDGTTAPEAVRRPVYGLDDATVELRILSFAPAGLDDVRPRRRARRGHPVLVAAITGVLCMALGAAIVHFGGWGRDRTTATATATATATVVRANRAEAHTADGMLGYGDPATVVARRAGTVTWAPTAGDRIVRGSALYRVDDTPVILLRGTLPMYRTLQPGDVGADVRQLEQNLLALGYGGFTVDDRFTSSTSSAVKTWQKALMIPATGTVTKDAVVMAPTDVRVVAPVLKSGDLLHEGSAVLRYTAGDARLATVDLDVRVRSLARVGGSVTVELPDGRRSGATVVSIGTVARKGAEGVVTVPITVRLVDPEQAEGFAATPVRVQFTADRASTVMLVPAAALVPLAQNAYGLRVVADGGTTVLPVQVGAISNGEAQISGTGIRAGMTVALPG